MSPSDKTKANDISKDTESRAQRGSEVKRSVRATSHVAVSKAGAGAKAC